MRAVRLVQILHSVKFTKCDICGSTELSSITIISVCEQIGLWQDCAEVPNSHFQPRIILTVDNYIYNQIHSFDVNIGDRLLVNVFP